MFDWWKISDKNLFELEINKPFKIEGMSVCSPVAVMELTIRWIRINTMPAIHLNTIKFWRLELTRETPEIPCDAVETHIHIHIQGNANTIQILFLIKLIVTFTVVMLSTIRHYDWCVILSPLVRTDFLIIVFKLWE